jgi:hypothetical protein
MKRSKSDANQGEIVDDARSIGASVFVGSGVGRGLPDLLVGFRGVNYLIEVKEDEGSTFTKAQKKFWNEWEGQKAIVYNSRELFLVIGASFGREEEVMAIKDRRPR